MGFSLHPASMGVVGNGLFGYPTCQMMAEKQERVAHLARDPVLGLAGTPGMQGFPILRRGRVPAET